MRAGMRAGLPIAAASLLLAISFGVLARPVMGLVAATAMSALVFAGSAQFAALAVLSAGGGAAAAVVAGLLLNARYAPMGVAIAPSLRGGGLRRALAGQAMIDAGWAMAHRGRGRYDIAFMVGVAVVCYPTWVGGTALGAALGDIVGDPERLGLDALFPAFFLALLVADSTGGRRAVAVAAIGALIALALAPFTPPGVPVIAACAAALLALAPAGSRA